MIGCCFLVLCGYVCSFPLLVFFAGGGNLHYQDKIDRHFISSTQSYQDDDDDHDDDDDDDDEEEATDEEEWGKTRDIEQQHL